MSYILALDQGTTGSRSIVFDRVGGVVSIAQREHSQIYAHPGWVEHDADEIWRAQSGTAVEALDRAGINAREIAAIGLTNQRETTVVWDRLTGRPIYNAIVWQDRRTAVYCDRIRRDHGALIRQKTGLEVDAYFSASKVSWILDNVTGARDRAESGELAFGTIDTWLTWKLTEGKSHLTDVSNASRTMLFDIHTLDWDNDLLDIFDVPKAILPEVRSSSEIYSETRSPAELDGIPIAGIAGDQQAALFGQTCFAAGASKCTYGTGCFLLQNTGAQPVSSANGLLTTVGWKLGEQTEYALEGSVFIGGAVVQWLRDELGLISNAAEAEPLAASVSDSGGVYFVPAFAGLGAPHWDQDARGMIIGLTRGSNRGHIARAALESIAFQTADLLGAMKADSGSSLTELRVDGGAAANDLLMQFQADILQMPVMRPKITETTALGAAYLAGLAVGLWPSRSELSEHAEIQASFYPRIAAAEAARRRSIWSEAVSRSLKWDK
ncbi:MAG: glycerol kinase GlpK [Acidobacteriota bacterium]